MTIELVDIPGFIQPESSKWKIKALQIDGTSPALAALDDWQQNREKDYKQIINVMKQVAANFRVTNPKQVKKTHSPKKHGSIYEMRAHTNQARLLFFYDSTNGNIVVCANAHTKGHGNQDAAFDQCAALKKFYESQFTPHRP